MFILTILVRKPAARISVVKIQWDKTIIKKKKKKEKRPNLAAEKRGPTH